MRDFSQAIVSAVLYLTGAAIAGAQNDPSFQFELFASTLFANSVSEGNLGIKGGRSLGARWLAEGSLSRLTTDIDLFLTDASVRYTVRDRKHTDLYTLAGAGLVWGPDADNELWLVHVGFGAEVGLGRRLFLRPEFRSRWQAEDLGGTTTGEISLGLGWRF